MCVCVQAETVPTLKTLVTAVVAGNLSSTLSSGGPFTVFAPNDKAFSAIDPSVLASLLRPENLAELDALLELHVVSVSHFSSKSPSSIVFTRAALVVVLNERKCSDWNLLAKWQGTIRAKDIKDDQKIKTLAGAPITITRANLSQY